VTLTERLAPTLIESAAPTVAERLFFTLMV
jgi:hypothetical protein